MLSGRVIGEQSRFRVVWDGVIAALVFFTCATVPYHLVFGASSARGLNLPFSLYVIDLFFLADVGLNFRTSYRRHGEEITAPPEVSAHYLRTNFAVDVAASVPFDVVFIGLLGLEAHCLVWVLPLLRLLRVVRLYVGLLRWEELGRVNPAYFRIGRFVSVTLLLIHWVACGWFFSSAAAGFPADSWVVREGLRDGVPATQYVHALYWAVTTMTTVGYGDITPARLTEYLLGIGVMLLGASLYAFLIGNIASWFSNLDAVKTEHLNRMEAVAEYLRYRRVPRDLSLRVRGYYEYLWAHHRGADATAVHNDLPEPLRLEILLHMTRDLLGDVPLFRYGSEVLRNVLLSELKAQTYAPGDRMVRNGELGDAIFFISRGSAEILRPDGSVAGTLGVGDYFGDISLLFRERRTASVRALTFCEVFVLSGEAFRRTKRDYPELRDVIRQISAERSEKIVDLVAEGIVL